ncbi:MAG TPA: alpha/beta hydrolase [Bryobacteraceae bacterium]|nr:alpha/beta hydrolase [Bryobacteraceae bacterium]
MEPLVLLPGLICDQTVWQKQMDALAGIAECWVADYESLDTIPAMAEAVLRTGPDRFSVAGHSMGGRVALEIYRRAPERIQRIALLNTGYLPLAEGAAGQEETRKRAELVALAQAQGMRAMLRQWLPPMIDTRRRDDTVLVNAIVEMMSRKTPEIFAAQVRALLGRPDAGPVLEQIRCPALLLSGREDGWSTPAQHAAMSARIGGSRLEIVPDSGHMSTMERPAEVSAALRAWLYTC